MPSLFSPKKFFERLFQSRRPIHSKRRRRVSNEQCLHCAVAEALEVRTLFSVATHLAFDVQPTDTVAGNSISSITVDVLDSGNSVVTGDNSLVVFTINTGPTGTAGTLFFAVPAQNGVATLSGLSFTTAGNYTLHASDGSLSATNSSSFAITPDAAASLVITGQPGSTTAGQTLSAVTVAVEDQYGNIVTTDNSNVTLALASGVGPFDGTLTVAATSGVATFSDLALTKAGSYSLGASDGSLTTDTSGTFSISPAAASKVVITQQTSSATAGQTLSSVTAKVEDQYGNVVTSDNSNVTIAVASGAGSLTGTLVMAASSGVATFSDLSLTTADAYTLGVSDGDLTPATSGSFNINPDVATHLVFSGQPSTTTAGSLGTVSVSVEDQFGNVITSDNSNISLLINSISASLGGTKTVAAVDGVATFSDLSVTKTGSYTLGAVDGELTGATSSSFTINPGAASQLDMTQGPSSTTAGQTFSTLSVQVEDQYGNIVTGDTSTITLSPSTGSLQGTVAHVAVAGVATFSGLAIDASGNYTVTASDASLATATSSSITISPAAASQVVITTEPTDTVAGQSISNVVAKVEDQFGNVITTDNSNVTIAIATGTGTLNGTKTVAAVNGVATFSGLSINQAAAFTLGVSDGELTVDTTSSITISPADASQLVITTQPTTTVAGQSISSTVVKVEDQYGNVVNSDNSNVTIAITTGTGTLNGTATVAASSGVATFSGLSIDQAGTFNLGVSDADLTTATTGNLSITPDLASQLVITTEPTSTVAGQTISNTVVKVEDQFGNVETGDNSNVTIALASGSGTLAGTETVAAVNGVATFSTLSINQVGAFTLGVSDGELSTDTSSSISITPAAASKLVVTTQPTTTVAGQTISNVVVKVEDQFGNIVTGDSSTITLALASGSGTLNGTLAVAASSGVATFSTLSLNKTGAYTLGASDGSLTGATSGSFTINPDAATHLAFTSAPSSGAAGALGTVSVSVEDQFNNVVNTDTSTVTLSLASGSGSLLGTLNETAVNGVATFSDLAIHTPGAFTLGATNGNQTDATSGSFTISPSTATQLAFISQPGSVSAGALGTVMVAVEDQYGNTVTSDSSTVTLSMASGGGTLLGTQSATAVNGVATFSALSMHTAGTFTLGANDGQLSSGVSSSFTVSPTAATQLIFTQQPTSIVVGNQLTGVNVSIEDQYGNVVTTANPNVTFTVTGGGSTLNFVVAASSGVAVLNNIFLVKVGTYSVKATSTNLTLANSNTITVTPDVPSQLVITTEPTTTIAGQTISNTVVKVEDQFGNVETSDNSNVTIALASGSGTLAGTETVAAVNGVATFSTLSINQVGAFTLGVSDGELSTDTSSSISITPAAASKLVVTTQPITTVAGQTISNVVVKVEDQFGNIVTGDSSTITLALASGSGTLNGTLAVAASSGVATFSTLSLNKTGAYTLGASDGSLTGATSGSFTINPDAATHLAFTSAPSSGAAGALGTVSVSVEDQFNNVVNTDTSTVTLSLASGSGSLLGTLAGTAVDGVATFSDLAIHTPGAFTLGATNGNQTDATSGSFTISPAAATHLVITTQPTDTVAGQSISNTVVKVEDQYGNVVTSDNSNVTLAISTGSGTLNGTATVAASSGIATFSTLSINQAGAYTLGASDGGLTTATTSSITIAPAAASKLVVTTQPTTTIVGQTVSNVVVTVEDQYGNVVTTDNSNVTIAIATGTGTLNGTATVAASSGVATFSTLSINQVGTFTLGVSDGGLTTAATGNLSITPDAPTKLVITTQPTTTIAGQTISNTVVKVEDQFGNVETGDNSNVTIALASGSGTLAGTATVAAVNGVATFSTLSINQVSAFTLGVSDGELTPATSGSFNITPAAASQLVFTQQPAGAVAGSLLAPIIVKVEDQFGNVVTSDSSNIQLAVNTGNNTVSLIVAASSGVATFSGFALTKTGSFNFRATDGGLPAANSASFSITPDVASQLVVTTQPSNSAAGVLNPVAISVEDQYGNVVTSDNSNVTMTIATGSGSLGGTVTVAATSGVATFNALSLHTAGAYTLGAADGELTGATTNSLTISPAAASQLVITTQPTDTTAGQSISNLVAKVEDAFGNVVTTDNSNVTITIASGSGTLNGTKTVAAVNGIVTFSNLSINQAGSFTLGASDGNLTSATSSSIVIATDVASKLVITTEPTTTVAGQTISNTVVKVEDQFGNVIGTDNSNVTLAIASGTGSLVGTTTVAAANGVATFSTLSLDQAGAFTLGASDGELTTATSSSFTITPDTATQVVITTQPTDTVAGQTISTIVAKVEDQFGNVVTSDNSNVTVAIASGNVTLHGTKVVTAANGVATLSTLSIDKVGAYTLAITDGELTQATTGTVNISVAAASQLVFTQQPSDVDAGNLFSDISVAVEDAFGNIVTTSNANITIGAEVNDSVVTASLAAVNGVATFSGIGWNVAGTYQLTASGASLPQHNSGSFTVSPAAAAQVGILTTPEDTTAGQTIGTITAAVVDQYGNLVTSDNSNVTISVASGPGTLGGTTTVAAVDGVATFGDLSLTQTGTYAFGVTDGELETHGSSSFAITPDDPSQLVIATEPGDALSGANISSVAVDVEDQFGNIVTTDNSNVTIFITAGAGSLSGTTTLAAHDGVATFSGLSLDLADDYTLGVSDLALTGDTTDSFTISPGAPTHVVFTQEPATGAIGGLSTITVAVEDAAGNVVTSDNSNVTIGIATGSGTLTGTTTVAAEDGIATFSDLGIAKAGSFTLSAGDASLTGDTSDSFSVGAKLVFQQQPATTVAGVTMNPLHVLVEDSLGHILTNDNSSVSIAIFSGPNSSELLGTLTVNAVNGIATFDDLALQTSGAYKLQATDGAVSSVSSSTFNITPAAVSQMVLLQDASDTIAGSKMGPGLRFQLQDQFGNVAVNNHGTVSLSVSDGPNGGALAGTLSALVTNGVATFNNVILQKAGSYTIHGSVAGVGLDTQDFNVAAGVAKKVIFLSPPTTTAAGGAISDITAEIVDAFGNVVTTSSANVTLALSTGPTGGTLTPVTVAAVNGVATFSGLSLTKAGAYKLKATSGALTLATSAGFTITPAAASQLAFVQGPKKAVAGVSIKPGMTVRVLDAFGNVVTSDNSNITLTVNTGPDGSSVGGTATVAVVNGVATFGSVNITKSGTYTLQAADGELTSAISSSFVISPAAATHLVYVQQPTASDPNAIITPAITVKALDAFGNVVTGNHSIVKLSIATGTAGALAGTLSATLSNGVATFSNVKITTTGGYTLRASDGLLTAAVSDTVGIAFT